MMHQTNAIAIQMSSCRPTGTFHQCLSAGGINEVISPSPYLLLIDGKIMVQLEYLQFPLRPIRYKTPWALQHR